LVFSEDRRELYYLGIFSKRTNIVSLVDVGGADGKGAEQLNKQASARDSAAGGRFISNLSASLAHGIRRNGQA